MRSFVNIVRRHIKLIGFLFSVAALVVTLLLDDDFDLLEKFPSFAGVNPWYVLGALLLMCASLCAEGFTVYFAQRRMGYALPLRTCLRINTLSRCYGALTPVNAASHPTLIGQLMRRGVSAGAAGSVGAMRYVAFQCALTLIAAWGLGRFELPVALRLAVGIGFIVNAAPAALLLLLTLNARAGTVLLDTVCRPFKRRGPRMRKRALRQYERYREGVAAMRKRDLCVLAISAFVQAAALLAVPAAACAACGGGAPLLSSALMTALLTIAVTAMPTPGGSGVAESGFLALFTLYLPPMMRLPALLIWRGATYYFVIIAGAMLQLPWRRSNA